TPRGEKVRHTIGRIFGVPFADALAATPALDTLLAEPFEAMKSLPALEALLVTGCVTGVGPVVDEIIEMVVDAEPPALEELSGPLHLPPPPVPARPPPFQDFGDETSDAEAEPYEPEDGEIIQFDEGTTDGVPIELPAGDSSLVEIGSEPI